MSNPNTPPTSRLLTWRTVDARLPDGMTLPQLVVLDTLDRATSGKIWTGQRIQARMKDLAVAAGLDYQVTLRSINKLPRTAFRVTPVHGEPWIIEFLLAPKPEESETNAESAQGTTATTRPTSSSQPTKRPIRRRPRTAATSETTSPATGKPSIIKRRRNRVHREGATTDESL